jgi:hypothetical protein
MNDFSLDRHKGKIEPYPPFMKPKEKDFIMVKSPKELLLGELVCYMTKIPLKEHTLGIGVSLQRNPRTGLVSYVNPTTDLMSMRAFTKLKVRKTMTGERFTHWLPLYFGEDEVFEVQRDEMNEKISDTLSKSSSVNSSNPSF